MARLSPAAMTSMIHDIVMNLENRVGTKVEGLIKELWVLLLEIEQKEKTNGHKK